MIGSFANWCRVIGGILEYAGVHGFLDNLQALHDTADEATSEWEVFLRSLLEVYHDEAFTVAELMKLMRGEANLIASLPSEIRDAMSKNEGHKVAGWAFRRRAETRYGTDGIHVIRVGEQKDIARWKVVVPKSSS